MQNSPQTIEYVKLKPRKSKSRDLVAVLLWFYLLTQSLIFNIDSYLIEKFPFVEPVLFYKSIIFIGLFFLFWYKKGYKKFFIDLLFIASYPLIVLFWKLPKLFYSVIKNAPFAKRTSIEAIGFALVVYFSNIRYFRFRLLAGFLFSTGLLFIFTTNSAVMSVIACSLLLFYILAHFFFRFRTASGKILSPAKVKKSKSKNSFAAILKKQIEGAQTLKEEEKGEGVDVDELINEKLNKVLITGYNSIVIGVRAKEYLDSLKNSPKLIFLFFGMLLYSLFLTILTFAFIYTSINNSVPGSFEYTQALSFGEFLYYSLTNMLPAVQSGVTPVNAFAKTATAIQATLSFLLLGLLILVFFEMFRRKYQTDMDELASRFDDQVNEYKEVIITEYKIAPETLEEELRDWKIWND